MKIIKIPINKLKPSEYNPRQWPEKAIKDLKRSIEEFGLVDPLVVNSAPERKNIIIGGHFRLKLLKEEGIKEVDNLGVWDYTGDNEKKRNKIQKMENMPHLWEKVFC